MTIEKIKIELDLHFDKKSKRDFLKSIGQICDNGYFIVTDDGICHLFDEDGNEDDISKIKKLDSNLVPEDIVSIVIPDSVTSIGDAAFHYCTSLTSMTIGNSVMSIGEGAFYDCTNLTSVTIPDSAMSIGYWAFYNCTNLTNVTIGNGVTSIGRYAFDGCSSLMSVTIGNNVKSIGGFAFADCSSLKSFIFKGKTLEEVKAMDNYPFGLEDESIIRCE